MNTISGHSSIETSKINGLLHIHFFFFCFGSKGPVILKMLCFSCAVQTDIFSTSDSGAGVGFTKNAGSTTLVGNLKTYVAESHLLEAGAITPIPDITTASHDLFFKCTVDINCYDDSTGSCSGVRQFLFSFVPFKIISAHTRQSQSVGRAKTVEHLINMSTYFVFGFLFRSADTHLSYLGPVVQN